MPRYPSVSGSSQTQTKSVTVTFPNNSNYSESWTYAASVPTSVNTDFVEGIVERRWKSPQSDKSSFKTIKKSGLIKMTNYDVGSERKTFFTIDIPRASDVYVRRGAYTLDTTQTAFFDRKNQLFDLHADYTLKHDIQTIKSFKPTMPLRYIKFGVIDSEVSSLIADVMEEVVSKLNSSYDPLTELAELRSSLELLHSMLKVAVNPISSFRYAISSIKDPKKLGDLWMTYRYGIMPIVYSIHDILETMRRIKLVYHTERSFRKLNKSMNTAVGVEAQIFEVLEYNVRISGTGKQKPSSVEFLRLIDNLSINPFKTAWELIPFSFVVDWFVNVGNYIDAQTSALYNFSSNRGFCHAIKGNFTLLTYYRDYHDDRRTLSTGPWYVNPPKANVFDKSSRPAGSLYNADYLLKRETLDWYSRRTFIPSDIELRFDPFLNWKRWVDAFVLSLGKTRSLIRN